MHIVYGEHCMRGCSCWSVVWLWASLVYCVNYKMHIGLEGLHNCRWVWSIPTTTVVQVLVGWVAVGSSWRSRRGAVSRPDWVLTIISSRSQVRRRRGVSSCAPTYPTNTNTNTNTNASIQMQIQVYEYESASGGLNCSLPYWKQANSFLYHPQEKTPLFSFFWVFNIEVSYQHWYAWNSLK